MNIVPEHYPETRKMFDDLLARHLVSARSLALPSPYSDAGFARVERGETPRNMFIHILRAREAAVQREVYREFRINEGRT